MGAKIAAFLLTTTACLAVAVVLFFAMILAMNGYSESDAVWGMAAYAVLTILTAILAGVAAVFSINRLVVKQFGVVSSILIAVPLFSIIGSLLTGAWFIVGIFIAELVRTNF